MSTGKKIMAGTAIAAGCGLAVYGLSELFSSASGASNQVTEVFNRVAASSIGQATLKTLAAGAGAIAGFYSVGLAIENILGERVLEHLKASLVLTIVGGVGGGVGGWSLVDGLITPDVPEQSAPQPGKS